MASWTRRLLEETDSDASRADLSASCGRSERTYRYVLPTLTRPSRGLRSDIASYRFSRSLRFSRVIAPPLLAHYCPRSCFVKVLWSRDGSIGQDMFQHACFSVRDVLAQSRHARHTLGWLVLTHDASAGDAIRRSIP